MSTVHLASCSHKPIACCVLYRSGADAKDMPGESKRTPLDDVGMSRQGSAGGKPGFNTFDSEFDRSAAPKRDSPMSPTRGAAPVRRGSGVASSSSSSLQPLSAVKKYRLGQKVECNFKGMPFIKLLETDQCFTS
jgi:hypothetical protein